MRPQATATVERVSNFDGYSQDLGVDQASVEHLMMLLTNLYSDPALAVIREYSTNALDSHRAAGVDTPIKVQLPSYLQRNFVVEDFGVGMSTADIKDTYLLYGASTKRDSDEQTGMLGLGCKAALTFRSQFFIQARKDGLETSVVLSVRDSDTSVNGVPHAEFLVVDAPTSEPNGVKVTIPVDERESFNRKALDFFKYWSPEDVSIAGYDHPQLEGWRVDDDLLQLPANNPYTFGQRTTSRIVMGGVAYPIDFSKIPALPSGHHADRRFVKWVPIGSVNFTPSREELHYTARTIATVQAAAEESLDRYTKHSQAEVDACATHHEALRLSERFNSDSGLAIRYTYKGVPVPRGTYVPLGDGIRMYSPDDTSKSKLQPISHGQDNTAVFVQNFDHDRMTPTRRAKLRMHLEGTKFASSQVLLLAGEVPVDFDIRWSDSVVYEWKTIGDIVLPRNKRDGETKYTEVNIATASRTSASLDDLAGTDVLYYSPTELDRMRRLRLLGGLKHVQSDWRLLEVSKGSWGRIMREHDSKFVHVRDFLEEQYDDALSKAPYAARLRDRVPGQDFLALRNCRTLSIDDPELRLQVAKIESDDALQKFDKSVKEISMALYAIGGNTIGTGTPDMENPIANYPLARYTSGAELEEYINATYAWRN